MTPTEQDKVLREKLAAIEHQRWADWQKWVHKVLREANPSPEIGDILERWDRQIETPYEKLSDSEKASDMEQVDRYWHLITADRKRVALEARIDTATDILYGFSRTYKQEVTDSAGNVYVNESHGYISRYEVQELVAELKAQQEEVV